ncbi:STAS domain-containing protein [Dongshaea marina]|uniref:STAS domain-containing protein n=1 Tax=Dongshaea marina TaxID=2047966 RepID=UPI000D3E371D|nr:STAS domain-containing protein [Dongshaea marina]
MAVTSITCHKANEVCRLTVHEEMTIYTAAEQKKILLHWLQEGSEIQLNLAGVSEVDSAGLQLLLLLQNEAELARKKVHFVEMSDALQEVLRLLHLQGRFSENTRTGLEVEAADEPEKE